jgi:ABC-type antimicrobial peptide transport system permease subunit
MFPGEDPIGHRIQAIHDQTWFTVVGVAENVRNGGLVERDDPEIYFLRNNVGDNWDGSSPLMLVSSVLSPKAVAPWVRSQIAQIDPTVPVKIETLDQQVSKLADRPRFETALLGFFALCGLLMAVIGLYGVIAFVAAQRTQEIGVRMALGATRWNILRLIAAEGVQLIVWGGVVGIGAALATAQLLRSLLFGIGPHDPATYAGVALLLALVALAATLLPARAAMKVEPVEALRYE